MPRIELIHGYSEKMAFPRLREMLRESTGYIFENFDIYRQATHLRTLLFTKDVSSTRLVECTLRFAFETIEPMMIEFWSQIILHLAEYEFDMDMHIETALEQYQIKVLYRDRTDT